MIKVFDIAKYILSKKGKMTSIKLQKLCYYSQAWSLVWDGIPLFNEEFEAWPNGPVCVELDKKLNNKFVINKNFFDDKKSINLSVEQKQTIDAVLDAYGDKDGYYLMQLTHIEKPWKDARGSRDIAATCNNIISKKSMQVYYGGLCAK